MMNRFILFLEHSFALIREDKLYSAIYIAGTAVAIASAMVIVIVLHTMVADIAPEVNRSRTLYVSSTYFRKQVDSINNHTYYGDFSDEALDSCFRKMKSVEAVTGVNDNIFTVCDENYENVTNVTALDCDPDFFRLYEFTFLEGRPFSEKEYRDHERVCVISEEIAKKMGHSNTLIDPNQNMRYHVVGVVKKVSSIIKGSAADIYMPRGRSTADGFPAYYGYLDTRILLREGYSYSDFINELEPLVKHYNAILNSQHESWSDMEITVKSHFLKELNFFSYNEPTLANRAKTLIPPAILVMIFLLLPAINLSGMVTNRMEARRAEMGIRKTFGAKRRTLLNEVIHENLVLTLCGGVVGWGLSVVFIKAISNSRFFIDMFNAGNQMNYEPTLNYQMFFTPTLFIIAFLCCAVLNLMAALIPAWRSLKKPIVESLNLKR